MKRINRYPLAGFLSASLMIISYLYLFVSFLTIRTESPITQYVRLYAPLLVIIIFLAFRHILVLSSKLMNIRLVINLLIITQVIIFIIGVIMKFKLVSGKIMLYVPPVVGLVLIGLYIWFFVVILMIEKDKIKALSFLQLFAITFLVIFVVRILFIVLTAIPSVNTYISPRYTALNVILQIVEKIPYTFLIVFFFKYIYTKNHIQIIR